MRIIAGKWRGRPLVAPEGEATRPTADRVREALFSMLASRLGGFDDLRVADLFAGTGALGLEALSRGVAHCTFVEPDPKAAEAIERNIGKLGASGSARVLRQRAEAIGRADQPCDILFLDPPYGEPLAAPALARLHAQGWIAPHAWISVETMRREEVAVDGFTVDAVRDHGKARIHLLRVAS